MICRICCSLKHKESPQLPYFCECHYSIETPSVGSHGLLEPCEHEMSPTWWKRCMNVGLQCDCMCYMPNDVMGKRRNTINVWEPRLLLVQLVFQQSASPNQSISTKIASLTMQLKLIQEKNWYLPLLSDVIFTLRGTPQGPKVDFHSSEKTQVPQKGADVPGESSISVRRSLTGVHVFSGCSSLSSVQSPRGFSLNNFLLTAHLLSGYS